jgi:hypothetical protein
MYKEIYDFKKMLEKQGESGFACDLDDTLSATVDYYFGKIDERFPNEEDLSISELKKKYGKSWNVATWQTDEVKEFKKEIVYNNEKQKVILPLDGALKYMSKVHEILNFVVYITARPQCVVEGSNFWLEKHGFPKLPIIARPEHVSHEESSLWKAQVLKELYRGVEGIVDNEGNIAKFCEEIDYKGEFILIGQESYDSKSGLVTACRDWESIYFSNLGSPY